MYIKKIQTTITVRVINYILKVCVHIFHICLVWFILSCRFIIVSYNCPFVLFSLFFCNKFEIWWLYQTSTVNSDNTNLYIRIRK